MTMEKTIHILGAMVAAINNMRLYPPGSGLISNSIDKAFQALNEVITPNEPLLIAESENNLLISGEPLSFKLQQFPQVTSFKGFMTTLRIRSIILKKDMDRLEFRNFLTIMSKTSEEVDDEGGIQKVKSKYDFRNISITPSLYANEEKAKKALDSVNFSDIDLIKSFTGERKQRETDLMRIGEKAADSRWVSDFFKSAIALLKSQGITITDNLYTDTVSRMVQAFSKSTPRENWARVSASISKAIGENEKELMAVVMVKNVDEQLFDTLISALTDDLYVELVSEINKIRESQSYGGKHLKNGELEQFSKAFNTLKHNQKTERLKDNIRNRILSEKKEIALAKAHIAHAQNKILQGDMTPLSDPKIAEVIPETVGRYLAENKKSQAMNLIDRLADGLMSESVKDRALASSVLMAIGEVLTDGQWDEELKKLADRLNIWVKFETELTYNYKSVCKLLQNYARNLLMSNRFAEANSILETFSFISDSNLQKNEEIKVFSGNMLRGIVTEKVFSIVFDEFINNSKNEGKHAYYTLVRLGDISVIPLLDLLKTSEDMSQRVRVINTLGEIGKPARPHIIERIRAGAPWFYMRNLLKLLSQLGTPEEIELLKPLLVHENDKIPKLALSCAFDIGGDQRLKFFTHALQINDHGIKVTAADLIGKLENEEGVFPLCQLLKSKGTGTLEQKNELDLTICAALKRIGSKKAIPALKTIETQKGLLGISPYSPALRQAAAATLKYLQDLPSNGADTKKKTPDKAETTTDDLLLTDPARFDALVEEYINRKNIKEAVNLLYKMTIRYAREKNFAKAEELREKLFNVDPMALGEIVRTGDIIEEEKKNAVLNDYLHIWGNLYEQLTNEEANALFYNVKPKDFPPDQTLIVQHEKNSTLFFINRGQLKIVYRQGNDEFFLKMLGAGDIAGEDTFFPITVSTVSLITMSQVKAGCLDRETLKVLNEKHPGLEEKLKNFCSIGGGINSLVTKKGLERRQQKRISLAGGTMVQLLDLQAKPMGKPFKGTILDISTGGISFSIKTSNRETTRLLLGRKVNMTIGIKTKTAPIELRGIGTIIGAKERKESRFSLHLKFDNPIMENKMIEIVSQSVPI
jgi:CRP-like cAMP-binding protein/HEAT repeat protein